MKACSIVTCDSPAKSRGWCGKHYARWRRHGDPEWLDECHACGNKYEPSGNYRNCLPCRERGCIKDNCGAPLWARGLCRLHHLRSIAEADPAGVRAYQRAWYAENRQHALDYAKAYAQANPERRRAWMDANRATVRQWSQRRRARLRENGVYLVTAQDLDRLMRVHDFGCAYCEMPLTDETVTWDHIVPISRGGCHSVGNLAPACKPCNSAKRDRTVMEWRTACMRADASRLSVA